MGTLTKHVTDVTSLGNYTVYGSSTAAINEATIEGQPIGAASISVTISGNGAALAAQQTIIELSGQSGDQLIRILLRSDTTTPTIPTDRTLIDINVASTASTTDIASALNTALINSGIIESNSLDSDKVIFSPDCGGDWTSTITGSSAIIEIVDGVGFTGPETVTQTGVRLTLGSTGNGFNQTRLLFDAEKRSVTNNFGFRLFFTSDTGGTGSGWRSSTEQQFFSMRGDDTTNTVADVVASTIAAWNADVDSNGGAMDASLGTLLWDFVPVTGDDTSFDVYEKDGSDLNVPTIFGGRNDLNMTIASTSRDTTIQVPINDPHKSTTPSQVRFFDPLATNLSQVAPNYIKTGAFCTWNMDNLSIDFGAGFRFNNLVANSTSLNWDQIDIIKSGDGQGSGGDAMFRTNIFLTLNWKNCTVKWYPMAIDSNLSAFMLDAGPGNIILQWDRVFLRYSGNSQMHIQFEIDKTNSFINNSGIIGDGVSTGGVFNNPVTTFPLARFLTPFSFINQNRPILVSAAPADFSATDSYTDSSLFVGFEVSGSGVTTSTEFMPFANQTSFFKYVNFISGGQIYVNGAGFTNAVSSTGGNPDGSIEYAVSFDPSYFDSSATDLTNVRNEFRYGSSTDNDELRVKETFESGPIGGSLATITTFETNTANLAVGDIFTIPRPNGLTDIKVTAVSGTPIQSGDSLEFNIGTDIDATVGNITTAFRNSTNTSIGVWCIIPSRPDLIPAGTAKNFVFGNNIGGTCDAATYSGTASNLTITSLETGVAGSGTFTHPFNAGISYINATAGLLNTNTSTDNQYRANTSPSLGVGDNSGLFLTYNKTNYVNNGARSSNTQVSSSVYQPQYTVYTKRSAFRPEISTFNFSDGPQTLSKILVADIHWENVTKATADAYVRTSMNNTNDVYRWIENETDDRSLTGQSGLTGVYDRLIDFTEPVTAGGLIDFESLDLQFNTTGTNPTYVAGSTQLQIPLQSSLLAGATTFGATTLGAITSISAIDYNTVRLNSTGNISFTGAPTNGVFNSAGNINVNAVANNGTYTATGNINLNSNATNGMYTANEIDSSGVTLTSVILNADTHTMTSTNATGCSFGPESTGAYIINHSGGSFDSSTLADTFTLNTTDSTLHGLTGNAGIINYTPVSGNFSLDDPGSVTNSVINFPNLTSDIIWNIDEDLSTDTGVNASDQTITLSLGPNGVQPGTLTNTGSGSFIIERKITAPGSWFYRLENASTGVLITENFTTAAVGSLTFTDTNNINAYIVRSDVINQKPALIQDQEGDIVVTFDADSNLDLSIQSSASADIRDLLESYVSNSTLSIVSTKLKIEIPADFNHDGEQQTTSEAYWNSLGGRGAGQFALKLFERQSEYAETVLNNLTTLNAVEQTQLFSLVSGSRLLVNTEEAQLRSESAATANAFYPGQFINNTNITNFSIIDPAQGFIVTYQAATLANIDEVGARQIRAEVGAELDGRSVTQTNIDSIVEQETTIPAANQSDLDDRRVTRENMNNLGILAPINDSDPTP